MIEAVVVLARKCLLETGREALEDWIFVVQYVVFVLDNGEEEEAAVADDVYAFFF